MVLGDHFFSSDTTQQQKNLTAKYILFPRRLPANLKMCGGTALGSGFAGADLVIWYTISQHLPTACTKEKDNFHPKIQQFITVDHHIPQKKEKSVAHAAC